METTGVKTHQIAVYVQCDCCKDTDELEWLIGVEHKVAITPEGAADPLPSLVAPVEVTDASIDTAIVAFDTLMPGYEDILVATVQQMSVSDVLQTVSKGNWVWNQATMRYRNTDSGTVITENTLIELRDELVDKWRERVISLSDDLASGRLTVQEWTLAMKREVSNVFSSEYMLAKGGRNAMFQADLDTLGSVLTQQNRFLQEFAKTVQAGDLSQAQIGARSELYMESATQAHERGKAARHGVSLPEYPGDGNQICRSRCRCRWDIDETDDAFLATWLLNVAAAHCNSCLANAAKWAPFTVRK